MQVHGQHRSNGNPVSEPRKLGFAFSSTVSITMFERLKDMNRKPNQFACAALCLHQSIILKGFR